MVVAADTSPINYLVLIEEIDILAKMYGTVVIPGMVREELLRSPAPDIVRADYQGTFLARSAYARQHTRCIYGEARCRRARRHFACGGTSRRPIVDDREDDGTPSNAASP